jgi:hypothetical protein
MLAKLKRIFAAGADALIADFNMAFSVDLRIWSLSVAIP